MTFEEYLASKKIDSVAFSVEEPDRWKEWSSLFEAMNPASFTSQKLYLINPVRRKYPLKQVVQASEEKIDSAAPKPVMRPKPKMN
jgi:hypothetical protein